MNEHFSICSGTFSPTADTCLRYCFTSSLNIPLGGSASRSAYGGGQNGSRQSVHAIGGALTRNSFWGSFVVQAPRAFVGVLAGIRFVSPVTLVVWMLARPDVDVDVASERRWQTAGHRGRFGEAPRAPHLAESDARPRVVADQRNA